MKARQVSALPACAAPSHPKYRNPLLIDGTARLRRNTPIPSLCPSTLVLPSMVVSHAPSMDSISPTCPVPCPKSITKTPPGSIFPLAESGDSFHSPSAEPVLGQGFTAPILACMKHQYTKAAHHGYAPAGSRPTDRTYPST